MFDNAQIAGAQAGIKGNEHNNFILSLSPTVKIPLKKAFFKILERMLEIEDGFEAYDCFSGQIEQVFDEKNICILYTVLFF